MTNKNVALMYGKLCAVLLGCKKDVLRFERGNAVAGVRIRAVMQDVRSGAKDMRDEIQKIKKDRKQRKQDAKES